MKITGRIYLHPAEITIEIDGCSVVVTFPRRRVVFSPDKASLLADGLILAAEESNKMKSLCGRKGESHL